MKLVFLIKERHTQMFLKFSQLNDKFDHHDLQTHGFGPFFEDT